MHQPVSTPSTNRSPGTELVAMERPDWHPPRAAARDQSDPHAETLQRLNTSYLLAAREVARDSVVYACAVFGVTSDLAHWLASATIDEVLGLAALRICLFSVRLPERALGQGHARGQCASHHAPLPLMAMHAALTALSDG